jgi:hypothetical protein
MLNTYSDGARFALDTVGLTFQHPVRRWFSAATQPSAYRSLRRKCLHLDPKDRRGRARRLTNVLATAVREVAINYPNEDAMKMGELRPWSEVPDLAGGFVVACNPARHVNETTFIGDNEIVAGDIVMGCAILWTGDAYVGVLLPNLEMHVGVEGSWAEIPAGGLDPYSLL